MEYNGMSVDIIAPSYKAAKEVYGLGTYGTNDLNICLDDQSLLDLGLRYADFKEDEIKGDAERDAGRIALSLLNRGNFDDANEILKKLKCRSSEIIKQLDDLYTFTGNENYLRMKSLYRAKVFEEQRENIVGNYVTAMKGLGEELSRLNRYIMKFNEECQKSDMSDEEVERVVVRFTNQRESLDYKVRTVKDNYKGRMSEFEKYFGVRKGRKPKKGLFKRVFGNRKKR